jgi:hypothetical protein
MKGPSHNCGVRRRGDRRWESVPRRSRARRDTRSEATARVPKGSTRRGTGGSRLEAVAQSCTDAEAVRWPARSAARPAERTARQRRSGVRPRWFSAGQDVFDCGFLQKVE